MADELQRTTTFSRELAEEIRDYVKREIGKVATPLRAIGGRRPIVKQCWGEVTDAHFDTTYEVWQHAWKEKRWNYNTMDWEDVPEGRGGNVASNYAIAYPSPALQITTSTPLVMTLSEDPATGANIWIANTGIGSATLVRVNNATDCGGGKYNGSIWLPPTIPLLASGTLSEAELGIAGADCLIFNAAEVGQATNDLANASSYSKVFVGAYLGRTAGGSPVYGIDGNYWLNCI